MSDIWENIMLNLPGTDVANCLKVCKGLRSAIRQCLETSSKFKHVMDVAATAAAIGKGRILSSSKCTFTDGRDYHLLCALDGIWYHRKHNQSSCTRLDSAELQPNDSTNNPSVAKGNIRISSWYSNIVIHPTLDPKMALVQGESCLSSVVGVNTLVLDTQPIKLVHDDFCKWLLPSEHQRVEIGQIGQRPRCIRHRLFLLKNIAGERPNLVMNILNGTKDNSINDYVVISKPSSDKIMHLSSNEQVTKQTTFQNSIF